VEYFHETQNTIYPDLIWAIGIRNFNLFGLSATLISTTTFFIIAPRELKFITYALLSLSSLKLGEKLTSCAYRKSWLIFDKHIDFLIIGPRLLKLKT
jgi:hypothetical protein